MLFEEFIRRRLLFLLQPWLTDEPELELKIGFIRSKAVAKNLRWNPSVLNGFIDGDAGISIKEVIIEHFGISFSSWSAPAFAFEVRGVHLTLSAGDLGECSSQERKSRVSFEKHLKKILTSIDPEGTSMHAILEKMLETRPRSQLKEAFLNQVLKFCQIEIHNISIELEFSIIENVFACLLGIKKLKAKCQNLDHGWLLKGLIYAPFEPQESSFDIDGSEIEITLKRDNQISHILNLRNLLTCLKLNKLELTETNLTIPEINIAVSPIELSIFSALPNMLSRKYIYVRNGRQLWNLAASRLFHLISSPRFSWYQLVRIIRLWLCYVKVYKCLLVLIAHSDKHLTKQSTKMSQGKKLSSSLNQYRKVISSIEKELPFVAIALGRIIARDKAGQNVQQPVENEESFDNNHFRFFYKILDIVLCPLNFVLKRFLFILCLFSVSKVVDQELPLDANLKLVHENSYSKSCFFTNVGKVIVTVSPVNELQTPASAKFQSNFDLSYLNLMSFCFSIGTLSVIYIANICEQALLISCGQAKGTLLSTMKASFSQSSSSRFSRDKYSSEKRKDLKSILWGEPVQSFISYEGSNHSGGVCNPLLRTLLGEALLRRKSVCKTFKDSETKFLDDLFLLCEIKNSLTIPEFINPNMGACQFNLMLGKLNINLEHSSILFISLLLREVQLAFGWTNGGGRKDLLDCPETKIVNNNSLDCNNESFTSGIMVFLKKLPEKHFQLGIYVAGPLILLSLKRKLVSDNESQSDVCFAFNFHNVEVAAWPASRSDLTALVGSIDCVELKVPRFKEPQITNISISGEEIYVCQEPISICYYLRVNGFDAYLGDSVGEQDNEVLVLNPILIRASSIGEYTHSLSANVAAFSLTLSGTAMGLTCFLYMDELYVIFQAIEHTFSTLSDLFSEFESTSWGSLEFFRKETGMIEHVHQSTSVKEGSLICGILRFLLNFTFRVKSMDLIIHISRMNDNIESCMKLFNILSIKKLAEINLPECGIWTSIQQVSLMLSREDEKINILTEISEVRPVVFQFQKITSDRFVSKDLLMQSLNCLYTICLLNLTFNLRLGFPCDASSSRNTDNILGSSMSGDDMASEDFYRTNDCRSSSQSTFIDNLELRSTPQFSTSVLVMTFEFSWTSITSMSLYNVLNKVHRPNKFLSSLSVAGKLVSWKIQGGFLFIETAAVSIFYYCYELYLQCIRDLLSVLHSFDKDKEVEIPGLNLETSRLSNRIIDENIPETSHIFPQDQKERVKAFFIDMSNFSLVLVIEDGSGDAQEFVISVDAHVNFQLLDMGRKLKLNLSRLSIFSEAVHTNVDTDIKIPHFSSDLSWKNVSGDPDVEYQQRKRVQTVHDASCSHDAISPNDLLVMNCGSGVSHSNYRRYILKCLIAILSAEKYIDGHLGISQVWSGSISLSGFDMTCSLSEIQIVLLMVSSFSGEYSKETTNRLVKKQGFNDLEIDLDCSMEALVPDGAIVAIQDVHEHMYLTVEGDENRNNLVGTTHYSLVGERALFRVEYNNGRRWPSSVLWFSFISLFAKNELGEPLRLNCHPRSGFVDISGTKDQKTTLWRMLSYETESSSRNFDWELRNQFAKRTFYLVNKKNDLAVAFIDGLPEFVRKPGNPFKLKVFDNFSVVSDIQKLDSYPDKVSGFSHRDNALAHEREAPEKGGKFPCIDVSFEKISLTVVHEILDTKDTFPLLCGSIYNTQLIIQIMSSKTRVVSTSNVVLQYFDGKTNVWRELLHPVELSAYYRSNVEFNGAEIISNKFPLHIHCRIKEVEISLSEISFDILLFVIGKLNLAGPFSVRTSTILANCCKVENRTGLNLLCNCYNKQSLTIARQQVASIFLRQADLLDQHLDSTPVVSIQLAALGSFATSPIHLSHLHAQAFAWRTRIISLEDSRTYPGPSVVVDISRNSTDGLSILISPVIKLHNETGFLLELRFQRGPQKEEESATVFLKPGESVDDAMAMFDALNVSGGPKKALTSLSFGNFFFSFRPDLTESIIDPLVEWSEDFKGEKAVRLSGIFNMLSYKVRKTLSYGSEKFSFSTAHCNIKSENAPVNKLHFLIHSIARDVPVLIPDKSKEGFENNSSVTLQEQKTIFLLPTVRVINLLYSDIHVLLTVTDVSSECDNIGNQATISCGSAAHFYVDPSVIYFDVTLTSLSCVCKPVNSSECVKKLLKQKNDVHHLDIDLDFGGGKYFASLRLSRGHRGILEATIFTSYALKNDTDFSLYLVEANKKNLSRHGAGERFSICPLLGLCLPPHSTSSLFMKSKKVLVKISDDCAPQALLDLGALSGVTEISLESKEKSVVKSILKFGVSTGPPGDTVSVPSQLVTLVPRYVVFNGSDETIFVRQCYLQDDVAGVTQISSKQKTTLQLQNIVSKTREFSLFENFVKKHKKNVDDSLRFIQFGINESTLRWSGPVCIASLGCFFLKFRKIDNETGPDKYFTEFASVHVQEEGSTLALHFLKPPNMDMPYRVENCLNGVSITFYQKDFLEAEVLGSQCTVDYVWDDLNLPHKLVIQISDSLLLREISLDKLRSWKPFYKPRKQRNFAFQIPRDQRNVLGDFNSVDMVKVGYEVYADGPTRVLRICESCDCHGGHLSSPSSEKIQLRVSCFTIHLLEHGKQDNDDNMPSFYTPIIAARLGCINLDSLFTAKRKYNQIMVQSLSLEEKWVGAPFAAMLRKHHLDIDEPNGCDLKIVCVLLTTSYDVKQVRYLSVVLQPIDLNLDEETLMKIVPFWRTSLNTSNIKSQQYYFDHFEIHPVKIIASFLPGESYSSYSSSQETLRSLLHSVVQIPPIKNTVVELNGVLVTHAMITMRELLLRCARHYSWYAMRAIYMAKGSPLLPPDFVSMFDDLASSSLDVFFDPSQGLMNLPGLTLVRIRPERRSSSSGSKLQAHSWVATLGGRSIRPLSGITSHSGGAVDSTISSLYLTVSPLKLRAAGSNVLFAAITEISDSIMKGAEASGFDGMVNGFHQGILKIAMEPSVLGTALMEGGPDRKIKLDRSPGVDELYIEGYLQAMLDTMYRQAFLRVRVIDNQVILKNLPPNSSLIDEIMERVKDFLVSKALLKGDPSAAARPLRSLRGDTDWKIGPTVLTLSEHLFVSFAIRILRKQVNKLLPNTRLNKKVESDAENEKLGLKSNGDEQKGKFIWKWGLGKFVLSGILAYIDGRLCRGIPNPIARRIVSGFLLTFLDNNNTNE